MAIDVTLTTDDLTRLCVHAYNSTGWHSYWVFRPDDENIMRVVARTAVREDSGSSWDEPSEDMLQAAEIELQGTGYALP